MKTLIRTLMIVTLLSVATSAHAQMGYPVQTVHDSGYKYILYSSGNIIRESGWFRRDLIDDGTGSSMIAAGGGRLYVLKNNGNIWMWDQSRWTMADNGTGTSRIWVEWGTVYCQKYSGQVWRCTNPYGMQWQQVNGGWRNVARVANFTALNGN